MAKIGYLIQGLVAKVKDTVANRERERKKEREREREREREERLHYSQVPL